MQSRNAALPYAERHNILETLAILAIFVFCYFILAALFVGPPNGYDTYWHLKLGLDLLNDSLSPAVDRYSFTYPGHNVSGMSVVFDLLLALYVDTFGEISGLILFRLSYISLLFALLLLFFLRIRAPWYVVFLVVPLLTYFIQMRFVIRPDILTTIFVVISFYFYQIGKAHFSSRNLFLISLFILLWVNYHIAVIGYVIFSGLFFDQAVHKLLRQDSSLQWRRWFFWGILIALLGFAHPGMEHFLSYLTLSDEWQQYISEYYDSIDVYADHPVVLTLWFTCLISIAISLRDKQYGFAYIVVVLGYFSLQTARLVPITGFIVFLILAILLSNRIRNTAPNKQQSWIGHVVIAAILPISAVALYEIYNHPYLRLKALTDTAQHEQDMRRIRDSRYPVKIASYLNHLPDGGNVINTFNMGGYLLYALKSDYKIYIDGRTNILYPIEFYKHYLSILSDITKLDADARKYNARFAIFENSERARKHFARSKLFNLTLADGRYVLYSRNESTGFPVSSILLNYPMCWNATMIDAAKYEMDLSHALPQDVDFAVESVLDVVDNYIGVSDGKDWQRSPDLVPMKDDTSKRLTAHMLAESQLYEEARQLFDSIQSKNGDDIVMMAYLSSRMEDYALAEWTLIGYFAAPGFAGIDHLPGYRRMLTYQTLAAIRNNKPDSVFSDLTIDAVAEKVESARQEYLPVCDVGASPKSTQEVHTRPEQVQRIR